MAKGTIFKFHNDLDTDQIIASQYLLLPNLEEMKEHFDYIILDTPPVQVVADAQILSTKVDGTIIVVRAGVTKKEDVHDTVNTLKKVNANIIGTVLHAVDNSKNKYYYYYGEE